MQSIPPVLGLTSIPWAQWNLELHITRRRMQRTWSPLPVVSELLPDRGVDTDREISPLFLLAARYELMEAPEF